MRRFVSHPLSRAMRGILVCVIAALPVVALAANGKPNILVIWGDDIGQSNISAYSRGLMGYSTPNIDRIAKEGMLFTDYYGEHSCTAGRASFMLGQSVFRSGLSKVGLPGAKEGINTLDPTIPALLKDQGYATGQFGKNHFGDRDEHLPTNHGSDEFLGNLYHLNAEEEPEDEDYPVDMVLADGRTFRAAYGPRGVIHSFADGRIEDTGPLTRKRMETVDDEARFPPRRGSASSSGKPLWPDHHRHTAEILADGGTLLPPRRPAVRNPAPHPRSRLRQLQRTQ